MIINDTKGVKLSRYMTVRYDFCIIKFIIIPSPACLSIIKCEILEKVRLR